MTVKAAQKALEAIEEKVTKAGAEASAVLLGKLADAQDALVKAQEAEAGKGTDADAEGNADADAEGNGKRAPKVFMPGNNNAVQLAKDGFVQCKGGECFIVLLHRSEKDAEGAPKTKVLNMKDLTGITEHGIGRVSVAADPTTDARKAVAKLDANSRQALMLELLGMSVDDLPPALRAKYDAIGTDADPANALPNPPADDADDADDADAE
jgi:hypothetical protein